MFSEWYDRELRKLRFVDDAEFCIKFKNSVYNTLPNSAKTVFYDAKDEYGIDGWDSTEKIWKKVMPVVENKFFT